MKLQPKTCSARSYERMAREYSHSLGEKYKPPFVSDRRLKKAAEKFDNGDKPSGKFERRVFRDYEASLVAHYESVYSRM